MNYGQVLESRGRAKGVQEGMQQGEQNKALAIARNMLFQLHLGLDVIEKATGLSKEELEQLQKAAFSPKLTEGA